MKKTLAAIIFIVHIPLILLMVMAIFAPYIPPDKIVFPAFAGLASLWIFLILLIFVALLLILNPKYAIPGIIVLIIGIFGISKQICFHQKTTVNVPTSKFLSYNCQGIIGDFKLVKGKALSDSIAQFIAIEEPDVVCLQEFRGVKEEETEQFMKSFCEKIGATSMHYQFYFISATRNDALCLVTFSKYPIVARNVIQLGKRSIGMYTDMIIQDDTVRVFNIHLQSTRLVKQDIDFVNNTSDLQNPEAYKNVYRKLSNAYQLRAQQARLIALEIKKSPYPAIVCGDFNDTPTSFSYHRIASNLNDAFIKSGKGLGNSYNSPFLPPIRIDYILHNPKYHSANFTVYRMPYSDHFPISTIIHK